MVSRLVPLRRHERFCLIEPISQGRGKRMEGQKMQRRYTMMAAAALALLTLQAEPAAAAVKVCGIDPGAKGKFIYICIEGPISDADVDQFRSITPIADAYSDVVTVSLNSIGGSVSAAMKIGQIIREKWFWTVVDDNGAQCDSACVLVFAAGAFREAGDGSKVGIHRPHFPPEEFAGLTRAQAQAKYAALSEGLRAYLAAMGMSDQLHSSMMAVPSDSIRWLTPNEMIELSLIGHDPAYEEWLAARRVEKLKHPSP